MSTEQTLVLAKYLLYDMTNSTGPQILQNAALVVEDNKISNITTQDKISTSSFDIVQDFSNKLVLPGLINSHSHAAMTLYRGMADDLDLYSWLNNYIWPAEARTTANDIYFGAKLAAIEAILTGTTTFNSMYWHVDQEIKAFNEIGVRLLCGPGILNGIAKLDFNVTDSLIREYHGKYEDMIRIAIYPHAPYTVTSEEYIKINDYIQKFNSSNKGKPDLVMHTHLHESNIEMSLIQDFAKEKGFNLPPNSNTPTEYLDNLGVLNDHVFLAHAVGMNTKDIDIIASKNVGVSHNPGSNMKLGNSVAPVDQYLRNGVKIGLGTDSATSNNNLDMFEEIKLTALIHKGFNNNPTIAKSEDVLKMATVFGAQAMNWEGVGDIIIGGYADLITIDLRKPHLRPIFNSKTLISHLVYSVQGQDISDVMVNGDMKVLERKFNKFDIQEFLDAYDLNAQKLYKSIIEKKP
jgi:5-methylthioadenosine/S-adenosylhomocysteine deaminase